MKSRRKTILVDWRLFITLFFLLSFIFVFSAVPELIFNAPVNNAITSNNFILLNVTVRDNDLNAMDVKLYGGNGTIISNKSLIYRISNVSNNSIITYNWTSPKLTVENNVVLLMYFDNQTGEDFSSINFDSLIGLWHLDESSGLINDSSGKGNNGTYNGNLYSQTGKLNKGLGFDGINDYINYGNNNTLNFNDDNFSIALWFKADKLSDSNLLSKYSDDDDLGFQLSIINGYITFYVTDGNDYIQITDSQFLDNEWHHIATVKNNSDYYLYLDGSLAGSDSNNLVDNINNDYNLTSGYPDLNFNWFNGTLDEIAIYNRSLSLYEIRLLSRKKFIVENSGAYNGTGSSDTRPLFNYSGKLGPSLQFNGVDDFVEVYHYNQLNLVNDFSISLWIYPFDLSYNQTLLTKGHGEENNYILSYVTTNRINFGFYTDVWNLISVDASNLNQDSWNLITAVRNSTTNISEVYVNGIFRGSLNINSTPITNSQELVIGAYPGHQYFNGSIDELIIYNRTLTPTETSNIYRLKSGNWYWKFSAQDNETLNISSNRIFTIGAEWDVNLLSIGSVSATPSISINVINFTINNTGFGNANLTINISSNFVNTFYNISMPFNLTNGTIRIVRVNLTSPITEGLSSVTLTLRANNAQTNGESAPPSYTTSFDLITVQSQPFLYSDIDSISSTSITKGTTGIRLNVSVKNQGQGIAQNVLLYITLPQGWTNSSGDLNKSGFALDVGETYTNSVLLGIGTSALTGTNIIYLNVSGQNSSGIEIDSNYKRGDSISVSVLEAPSLGTGPSSSENTVTNNVVTSTTSSGGGSSVRGGMVTKIDKGETIYTKNTLEIVRGNTQNIPVVLTNLYENSILENITLELQGFMSQYVNITPIIDYNKLVYVDTKEITLTNLTEKISFVLKGGELHTINLNNVNSNSASITLNSNSINLTLIKGKTLDLDLNNDNVNDIALDLKSIKNNTVKIKVYKLGHPNINRLYFMEDRNYSLTVFAPPYLLEKDYNLTLIIRANLVPINSEIAGFDSKNFVEYRTLLFRVLETSSEEAINNLNKSRLNVQYMIDASFPVTRVEELLNRLEQSFENKDYSQVLKLSTEINSLKNDAFESDKIINEIQIGLEGAKSRKLKVLETENALLLAKKAFEREDFETALIRSRDAQLVYILETKNKVNILWLLSNYWWAILLSIMFLSWLLLFVYKKIAVKIIKSRLRDLAEEEVAIKHLIEELQFKHFKEGSISSNEYHKSISQYEARLNKVEQLRIKLRNKNISLNLYKGLKSLEKEEQDLIKLMKEAQDNYLNKGSLSKRKFLNLFESEKIRLAEIEEEKALLKDKLENKNKKLFKRIPEIKEVVNKIKIEHNIKKQDIKEDTGLKFKFNDQLKEKRSFLDEHKESILRLLDYHKPENIKYKKVLADVGSYDKAFFFCNNTVAKNIHELVKNIENLNEYEFRYHVNNEKNDFANFIRDVLEYNELADALKNVKDKDRYLKIIKEKLKEIGVII